MNLSDRCFYPHEETCVIRAPRWESTARRQIELKPQRPCQPFALMIWGHRPESTVYDLSVGNEAQMMKAVPAGTFSSLLEWEEFEALLDRRHDGHDAVRALWRLFTYVSLDLPYAHLGTKITLDVEGPFEHLVVLAKMPDWQSWNAQFEKASVQ